ncbi:MAG: FeoB-associated Cys-rich membrane protein [Kiritimatiellae bacterium]|nr:FeoB-associated Cys-rich membrane protein [Kiritimatiellia bacterium]
MAATVMTVILLALAAIAIRKQTRKGAWTKSCVGCAGHCSGGCECGCGEVPED